LKRALVTGSSGFLGSHLVRRLQQAGQIVHGVDIVAPRYPELAPDQFEHVDLRRGYAAYHALARGYDEVYDLAALVGGLGYIHHGNHATIATDNTLINLHVLQAAAQTGARYLFTSSAVVYPEYKQAKPDVTPLKEDSVFPAYPSEGGYGWQKLFHEQLVGYYRDAGMADVRIARLHNSYGTHCTVDGGKEKAPAALCRKVAAAPDGGTIDVWGDGEQTRSFTYVADTVEGLYRLMQSGYDQPLNIGSSELVTINAFVAMIAHVAGKTIHLRHDLSQPEGVRGRNSSNARIRAVLDWEPSTPLRDGIAPTYQWITEQVAQRGKVAA